MSRVQLYLSGCRVAAAVLLSLPATGMPEVTQALVLKPVLEGIRLGDKPAIIDGRPADPLLYPVSFQLATSPDEVCTWFLVSPRTLVTAAHCVVKNPAVNLKVKGGEENAATGGATFIGTCDVMPAYKSDSSADWALCLLDKEFPLPKDKRIPVTGYEVLSTDPQAMSVGNLVEISGFGCKKPGGTLSNAYLIGIAQIEALPPSAVVPGSTKATPHLIEVGRYPSVLCAGDSGGPAFSANKDGSPNTRRMVLGVNSKTVNKDGLGLGYISAASSGVISQWIAKWGTANSQKICGVHKAAQGCRPTQ